MLCIKCQTGKLQTIDTRTIAEGRSVRRRKKCKNCGERYTTHEILEFDIKDLKKNSNNYYIVIHNNETKEYKPKIINIHPLLFDILEIETITFWRKIDISSIQLINIQS